VNAPDRLSPWITRNLTRNAGEATLALEARDAEQARCSPDRASPHRARDKRHQPGNDVTNGMWLDGAFRRWAADSAARWRRGAPLPLQEADGPL